MGNERKAGAGTTDDGQNTCAFYAREQRADGGCAFMNANGFWNDAHMVKFGRVDKKRAKKKEGAQAEVMGKRPSDGSREGTREKGQRND